MNAAELFKFLSTSFKLNSVVRKTKKKNEKFCRTILILTIITHPPTVLRHCLSRAAVDTTFSASRRRPPARQCARDRDVVRMPFPCTVMAAPVARRYDDAAQRGDPSRPWTAYRRPAAQVWVSYPSLLVGKSLFFSCFPCIDVSEVVASISD